MPDILDQSAIDQRAALRGGKLSARELMVETLDRIAKRNPDLNAIVALRDRDTLLDAADRAPNGPLQGLPMAIKDLAETKDIPTTYGSTLFRNHQPSEDSPMVAALRHAGAVIIGKTNTPEWGLGSHSYNPVYGTTRNPHDRTKSAGGSSGGAGAALAARMVALADGSDMMGSLRNPAAWNNVYGFRPSYGLVPNSASAAKPGEMFLHQLSTNGPMARHVADLELLLGVMAAPDPCHPHSTGPYRPMQTTRPLKIGWLGDWGGAYPMEDGILPLCAKACSRLEQLGHQITEIPPPFSAAALWHSWTTLRSWAIAEKLRPLYENATQRAQLKPEAIWEIERGLTLNAAKIHTASLIRSDWFTTTARLDLDILALPASQTFPFDADLDWPKSIGTTTMDSYHRWMEVVVPASLTGLPAISVPAGFGADGLPMGLQLIAHRGGDAPLLALARQYEEAITG